MEENVVVFVLVVKNQVKLEGKGVGRLINIVIGKLVELNFSKDRNENYKDVIVIGMGMFNVYLFIEFVLQLFYIYLKKVKISF